MAAFSPASGKHATSVLRAHALEKTMDPLPAAVVRLEGALHV
jgi:hypothetical protein